jgi:hypothetical protein
VGVEIDVGDGEPALRVSGGTPIGAVVGWGLQEIRSEANTNKIPSNDSFNVLIFIPQ